MRTVVLTGHGGPEMLQVQERPDPPVGPGQVRVAVKAAGINFADTMARMGLYPDAPKTPCVGGLSRDFAEEVMLITGGEGVDVAFDALGPTSSRKDYRLLRQGGRLIMYGLSESSSGGRRNLSATVKSLAAMPWATLPWWKSLAMMNENKGVLGLNLLSWWDRERSLQRLIEPLTALLESGALTPVVAESFRSNRRAKLTLSSVSAATSARLCCCPS